MATYDIVVYGKTTTLKNPKFRQQMSNKSLGEGIKNQEGMYDPLPLIDNIKRCLYLHILNRGNLVPQCRIQHILVFHCGQRGPLFRKVRNQQILWRAFSEFSIRISTMKKGA